MPRKKHTPEEIRQNIDNLVEQNLDRTRNVELDLKFQKYECERNKLEAFHQKLDQKKVSTVHYLSNLDSCI